MSTTIYGGTTNHWRAYGVYEVSESATAVTVKVSEAGIQSVSWGFSISSGITTTASLTGQSSASGSGGFSSSTGATTSKSLATASWTVSKGSSAQSLTLSVSTTNASGYMNGTSTASATVGVAALATYTVSYNANGGSGAPSSQTKTYGKALTLSSTKPTRTGYSFQGWATSSSGSVAYAAGASYTANAAVTLYAVWKADTYTVSYNANGGSGAPSAQTKTYGVALTLSTTKPTRTGYSFQGWATSSTGSVAYAAGGSYTANAAATLYAVWKADTYSVTYNANGGSGAPSAQTKTYGVALTLSTTKPTRSGYNFKGWATSSSGSVAYAAGGSYTANAAATLYAVWKVAYIKPTVSGLSLYRCASDGTADETAGTYAHVYAKWSVDTTATSGNAGKTLSVQYKLTTATSWTSGGSVALSGTGGTYSSATCSGKLDVGGSYDVRVTVTDTAGGSAYAQGTLGAAFATLDVGGSGKSIGFGQVASGTAGVDCAMDVRLSAGHHVTTSVGGSWIKARDNASVYNGKTPGDDFDPVASVKSVDGAWSIGTLQSDNKLWLSYSTDTNYSAGTNSTSNYSFDTSGNYSGKAANVTGTVAVANGGTGATNATQARVNLGALGIKTSITENTDFDTLDAGWYVTHPSSTNPFNGTGNTPNGAYPYGTLFNLSNGSNVAQIYLAHNKGEVWTRARWSSSNSFTAWTKMYTSGNTVPVSNGGTGATTAAAACSNLGAARVTASSSKTTSGNHWYGYRKWSNNFCEIWGDTKVTGTAAGGQLSMSLTLPFAVSNATVLTALNGSSGWTGNVRGPAFGYLNTTSQLYTFVYPASTTTSSLTYDVSFLILGTY